MDSTGPRAQDFMKGYVDQRHRSYMNVGFVSSPYPGKVGMGDYGPLQGGGVYYRPENPTYPYLPDFSRYNPYPPSLAYAQDIPKCNRDVDMALHYPDLFVSRVLNRRETCSSCQ
jgi:hypothetical protein